MYIAPDRYLYMIEHLSSKFNIGRGLEIQKKEIK